MKINNKILFSIIIVLSLCVAYPIGKKPVVKAIKRMAIAKYRPDVSIVGPIVMADGIGRQAVELAQVLAKKYRVQIQSKHVDKMDLPAGIRSMLKKKFGQPAKVTIVEESLWAPGEPLDRFFDGVDGHDQIRYAYSMLESTRIIPEWVMMINLYFDAVIVPDPFLIDAYVKSGVHVPVFYIPLGVDIHNFLQAPLKQKKAKGPFVFASLGTAIDRKNHIMAIQAFAKVFGNNENACLYINCRNGTSETRQAIVEEIRKQNCSNIKYTELCLKKDAYLKFFRSVDCLLSVSKGEGFSIQPREAMALGIPAIVTDNTGQTTICKSGLVKVVPSLIAEPCYYFNREISSGERFNCTLEDCVAAIEDVYQNYNKYLDLGPAMREWASAYDYSRLSSQYECLVSPKKVVLGDVNKITADCVYTDSEALYNKYMHFIENR
jgi:glycosyltransferase involved in cell wall biosynthesis